MLSELKIENVAIIESAELHFSRGFNILTGETGAGKSIILDSINAVLGERTSREILRTGTDRAEVTAVFTDCGAQVEQILSEFEIDCDGEVILRRRITADGKNSCRVNGCPVSVSMLKTLGAALVNIHGQHDSQALFQPEKHVAYIDALAGNGELLAAYKDAYKALQSAKKELASLETDESEKARRLDMLNYQIEELRAADIRIGERDELQNKITLYRNSETVLRALHTAYTAICGDDEMNGGANLFSDAAESLAEASDFFESMRPIAEFLESAALDAREYAAEIREAQESLDMDPRELDAAEERLDVLYRLSKKYGDSEEEMLQFLEKIETEAERITTSDEQAQQLRTQIAYLQTEAQHAAQKLTESRRKAGELFAENVCRELEFLNMPSVRFLVRHETVPLSAGGADKIEFLISANAGEPPRPIVKIASGGELSRIMLAIKNVLSACDAVDTLIFDEIDTGVSGLAAEKIGLKLAEVAESHQVICVTHLSQIAVMADTHLLISKSVRDGQTFTAIRTLDFEGRKSEIARIGSGSNITALQLENAGEMLKNAQERKHKK